MIDASKVKDFENAASKAHKSLRIHLTERDGNHRCIERSLDETTLEKQRDKGMDDIIRKSLRVGREIGVCQLKDSNLIVGLYPQILLTRID